MSSVIREWKHVRTYEEAEGRHDSRRADQRDSIVLYIQLPLRSGVMAANIITTEGLTLTLHTERRASGVFSS